MDTVRRIIAGETPYSVMKDMNRRGIPSPAGKQWTASNFKRQLLKKRYVIFDDNDPDQRGTLEHHGKEYRAIWPGIITRTEYELMLARFKKIEQPWDHGLIHGRTYLCAGYIYCGNCGGVAYGQVRWLKEGKQRRYRCRPEDNSGNRIGCGKVFRIAEPLEAYVTEAVLARFDTPEVAQALVSDNTQLDIGPRTAKLANLRQRKLDLAAEYGRDEYTKQEYKIMAAANTEAIRTLEVQIADMQSKYLASTLPALSMIREAWDTASIEWRRSVIQLLVEKVEILPHGHTGSATWKGWRFNPQSIRIIWREVAMVEVAASLSMLMRAAQRSSLALAA